MVASSRPPPPKIELQSQFLSGAPPQLAPLGASSIADVGSTPPPPRSSASHDRVPLPLGAQFSGPSLAAMPAAAGLSRADGYLPAPSAAAPAANPSLPHILIPDTHKPIPPLPPPDDAISERDGAVSDPSKQP